MRSATVAVLLGLIVAAPAAAQPFSECEIGIGTQVDGATINPPGDEATFTRQLYPRCPTGSGVAIESLTTAAFYAQPVNSPDTVPPSSIQTVASDGLVVLNWNRGSARGLRTNTTYRLVMAPGAVRDTTGALLAARELMTFRIGRYELWPLPQYYQGGRRLEQTRTNPVRAGLPLLLGMSPHTVALLRGAHVEYLRGTGSASRWVRSPVRSLITRGTRPGVLVGPLRPRTGTLGRGVMRLRFAGSRDALPLTGSHIPVYRYTVVR